MMRWLTAITRLLLSLLSTAALLAVVLLGLYASLGRLYMPHLASQKPVIDLWLSEHVPFPVTFESVEGDWQQLSPVIVLKGLQANVPVKQTDWHFEAQEVLVEVDVIRSLLLRQPMLRDIHINGGAVHMSGAPLALPANHQEVPANNAGSLSSVLAAIFSLGVVEIPDARLRVDLPGLPKPLALGLNLRMEHRDRFRRLRADITFGQAQEKPGRFEAVIEADQAVTGSLNVIDAWLSWQDVPVDQWLHGLHWEGNAPQLVDRFSGELWGHWVPGEDIHLQGSVSAPRIAWGGVPSPVAPMENFKARVVMDRGDDLAWHVHIPQLAFDCDGQTVPFEGLGLDYLPNGAMRVRLASLDLQRVRHWLPAVFPGQATLGNVLATLDPRGVLQPVVLALEPVASGREWTLKAGLSKVAIDSWHGAPAASGVSGYLEVHRDGGFVDLDASGFTMAFPHVYAEPMHFDRAQARVGWHLDASGVTVESSPITLESAEGNARGLLWLGLPRKHDTDHEPWMSLVIGLVNAPAASRNKYIPETLPPHLKRWLDESIGDGRVVRGGFIFDGPLVHSVRKPVVQLFLDMADAHLRFQRDWPALENIDGRLLVDDGDVTVWARQASILGSRVGPTVVQTGHDAKGDLWLSVNGDLSGPTQGIIDLLRHSPLQHAVGHTFDDWAVTGNYAGHLALGVPLAGAAAPVVDVTATVQGNRLELRRQGLRFEDLAGPLQYHSDSGLQSSGLTARLWGEPVQATIRSTTDAAGMRLALQANGQASVDGLKAWLDWPWLRFAKGSMPVNATLSIAPGKPAELVLLSDLKGLEINLPDPYRKGSNDAWPFKGVIPLANDPSMMDFRIGPQLRVGVIPGAGGAAVAVALGDVPFRAPGEAGITLYGRVDAFDWDAWSGPILRAASDIAQSAPPQASTTPRNVPFRVSGFYAGQARVFGQSFDGMMVSVNRDDTRWWVGLNSGSLQGRVGLPVQEQGPFRVELKRLTLSQDLLRHSPVGETASESAGPPATSQDPLASLDWSDWPDVDAVIDSLRVGQYDFGRWNFRVRPLPGQLRIDRLHANGELFRLDAEGDGAFIDWHRQADGTQSTHLVATFLIRQLDKALEALHYDAGMKAEESVIALDLHWPAAPLSMEAASVSGTIGARFTKGFLKSGSRTQTGALKILSVFNIDTILRRIRLDFSDLYQEGLAFDECKARLALKDGWIEFTDPVTFKGPGSHLVLEGRVDMAHDQLHNRLTVTLPVANSLPWLAALAGGLPAAVGVYVASKVLEKQVNSFTSLVYDVSGSLTDPQIQFQQLFDAKNFLPGFMTPRPKPSPEEMPPVVSPEAPIPAPAQEPAP